MKNDGNSYEIERHEVHLRLMKTMSSVTDRFLERDSVTRSIAIAFIAKEHVLLLGAPGTAKTELTNAVAETFLGRNDVFFDILGTKFSTPEEFFGPVDLEAYRTKGRYVRIVDGRCWDREVVFVDEIFKSSSSILNSLLKTMQDRKADNGGSVDIPLEVFFGASNEYPEDPSLAAFFDRFMIKHWVDYLADPANFKRMLLLKGEWRDAVLPMYDGDMEVLRSWAADIDFDDAEADRMLRVKAAVEKEGFRPSDRTWRKAVKLLKASAVVAGRDKIEARDYRALADSLWRKHEDRARLLACIGNAADPYGSKAEAIMDAVRTALRALPDISLLKTGKMRKTEIVNVIAQVSGRVSAELDKAREVFDASGGDQSAAEAVNIAEAALGTVDKVNREALFYREGK